MSFTIQHFIHKFSRIPDDRWVSDYYRHPEDEDCRCALGHCGEHKDPDGWTVQTEESKALCGVLAPFNPARINDGEYPKFQQPTPKARILAALEAAQEIAAGAGGAGAAPTH